MFPKLLVFLTLHQFFYSLVQSQNLEAIISNTRLPSRRREVQPIYDGGDIIYLIGASAVQEILRYSISNDSLTYVGELIEVESGNVIRVNNGDLYYFGGSNHDTGRVHDGIYRITLNPYNMTQVNAFPQGINGHTIVWDQNDTIYCFGGAGGGDKIYKYSISTNTLDMLNVTLPSPTTAMSSIWDSTSGTAYLFGGSNYPSATDAILKYNPAFESLIKLNSTLPRPTFGTCSIRINEEAVYVFGSFGIGDGNGPSLIRFNPLKDEIQPVPINNLSEFLSYLGCVYITGLNRIYLFGGWDSYQINNLDTIMYIDLN